MERSPWVVTSVKNTDLRVPVTRRIDRAFTYHWRLWSIPELRDAMRDAGFRGIDVYTRLADAVDHEGGVYVRPAESVDASWVVYVVARA